MNTITIKQSRDSATAAKFGIRIGRRRLIVAALFATFALIAAAVGSDLVLAGRFTPATAVSDYLNALSARDVGVAWSRVLVAAPSKPVDVSFLDEASFRDALSSARPDLQAFSIVETSYLDSSQSAAMVMVDYDTKSGTRQTIMRVIRTGRTNLAMFPDWRIVLTPVVLTLEPGYASQVWLDGRAVAPSAAGGSSVAVLPLGHKLTFEAGGYLQPQAVVVDAFDGSAATIAYQPVLTASGVAAAKGAVLSALKNCAAQAGAGCPQSVNDAFAGGGTWSIVGDPTGDLAFAASPDGLLTGSGHAQMVYAYSAYEGVRHDVWAGGYKADLTVDGGRLGVSQLVAASDLTPLQRPAPGTDQAALQAVSNGFKHCAATSGQSVADCPQVLAAPIPENVHWALAGDPTAGASVTFDPQTGIFTVHGRFDMTATYTVSGYPDSSASATTTYDALLLWDGSQLQLINIQGSFS
jgi:hypothetical protein